MWARETRGEKAECEDNLLLFGLIAFAVLATTYYYLLYINIYILDIRDRNLLLGTARMRRFRLLAGRQAGAFGFVLL